jgi:hypothetical protein
VSPLTEIKPLFPFQSSTSPSSIPSNQHAQTDTFFFLPDFPFILLLVNSNPDRNKPQSTSMQSNRPFTRDNQPPLSLHHLIIIIIIISRIDQNRIDEFEGEERGFRWGQVGRLGRG